MEQTLRIDEEFRTVLPPLSDEEFKQLEENILREGIINPIITWNSTIVDGHNRYAVAQKHPEVTFVTKAMEFANRYEVIDWIITHQRGQRNLTEAQRTVLMGRLLEVRKLREGGQGANQYTKEQLCKNCTVADDGKRSHSGRTSEEIGKEFGVAARTVDDAYAFHKGIEAIKAEDPDTANDILTGKVSVPKKVVQDIRKAEPEKVKETIKAIKDGSIKKKNNHKTPSPEDRRMMESINKSVEDSRRDTYSAPSVDDLIKAIKNNAIPYVRMLKSLIDGYKDIVDANKETVIRAIDEYVIDEINKLKEEI